MVTYQLKKPHLVSRKKEDTLGKKVEDRICKLCKLNIEDEIHFVCVCPKLQAIRYKYYNKICSCQNDSILTQFYEIITCKRVKLLMNFLADLWNLRNNILCN